MNPEIFHAFEQAGWQRAADHYADAFGGLTAQTTERLLDRVNAGAGTRLLDVATGPGYVAAAAAARGAVAVGLDFSAAMIETARRRYPHVSFREGDAEALPFADRSFDALTMNFGLLHLARPDTALAEARRVLVPGGRAAFTAWTTPDKALGFGLILQAIEACGRMDVPLPEGPPFFRFGEPDEARRSLLAAGFVDPRSEELPLVWRLHSADVMFESFSNGAVRTAALLRGQTPEALTAIRKEIARLVEPYRRGDAIELPTPALLTSVTTPS